MRNNGFWRSLAWMLLVFVLAAPWVGCSSSGDDPVIQEGVFIDSPVSGLGYETPTQSGVTDENGRFRYEDGQTIRFFIGGLSFGTTAAEPRLSPVDLVEGAEGPAHPAVTNMARLLLSLDADCDPENGIRIAPDMADLFPTEGLDFDQDPDAFGQMPAVLTLLQALNDADLFSCGPIQLWNATAARAHLRESLGVEAPRYTVDVAVQGAGAVFLAPAAEAFPEGTAVTVTAEPDEGWAFSGWTGDLSGEEASQSISVTQDLVATAVFTEIPPDSFQLSVSVEGQGNVALDPAGGVYEAGTAVGLTATPAEGWAFAEWTGALTGSSDVETRVVDADQAVTARFVRLEEPPPERFELSIETEGAGAVAADPPAADGMYEAGTEVTLSADPEEGWAFEGWSGAADGAVSPVSVVMDSDRSVLARFTEIPAPETYALEVSVSGSGAVEREPDQDRYEADTEVELTATPNPGWFFGGWTGDLSGGSRAETLVMDGDKAVTAVFNRQTPPSPAPSPSPTPTPTPTPTEYTLSVSVQGQGTVSPPGGDFTENTVATFAADPADGWEFAEWTGDIGDASPTDPQLSLTMDADRSVTAVFTEIPPGPYALAITITPEGQGTVSADPPTGPYDADTAVTLTPSAAEGWEFVNWSGDLGGSDNPATVTMDADKTITAVFERIQYELTLEIQGQGDVEVDPDETAFDPDTVVTLNARAADGWAFVQWTGAVESAENPVTLTMDADRAVTAEFQELSMTLSGRVTARGLPVAGAEVRVRSATDTTDEDGNYEIPLAPDQRMNTDGAVPGGPVFPVEATADGYATTYAKVPFAPEREDYVFGLKLLPVTHELGDDDDVTNRVDIEQDGEKIGELTIPSVSLPAGVTEVRGAITYIDPTSGDVDAFPGGDFLAVPEDDPNEVEILESYGLMEFDLVDQNGMAITDLPGDATVCMKIPGTLIVTDGETIPLWWYDPDAGLWREEGEGTVAQRADGSFWVCGQVSHFTWWNYDEPIETHACFKFRFVKESDSTPVTEFNWFAEGVSYAGTSPERPCDCDGDDPAPCPLARVSSFTVMRDSQIRVYATRNTGTRYYLKDDFDGTFSLSTDVGAATTFDAPDVRGSCIWGENVENCLFLDREDGVLPVGGINYAPDILSLTVSDAGGNGQVDAGETVTLTAAAEDDEGDAITPYWEVDCPGEANQTADDFTMDFTAPDNLTICTATFSATDANGNRSEASETIWVVGEPAYGRISGTVYDPDGNPAAQVPVRLSRGADPDGNWDALDQVVYTRPDGTYQFDEVPCDQQVSFQTPEFGFQGTISATAPVNGTEWTLENMVIYSCEAFQNDDCLYDLYFPTRWGTLQGTVYDDSLTEIPFTTGGSGDATGQEGGGGNLTATVPVSGGTYGPVPAPVGTVLVADSNPDSREWQRFPILRDGLAVTADIGSQATGTVTGTVFDDGGAPVPNVDVVIDSGLSGEQSATTDAGGVFTFTGVRTGIHNLYAQGITLGSTSGATTLFTKDQNPAPVADINGSGTTVEVTLYEYDGNPFPDTEVRLYVPGTETPAETTNAQGQVTFSDQGVGSAWISVWLEEVGNRSRGISVNVPVGESGSTTSLELQLPAPRSECGGF